MCTQVGLIAKRLGENKSISEKNPLMSAVNKLASYLALVLALVIVCATLVAFWTGYQDPQKPCAEKDEVCFLKTAVLRAVVMSVALIPHGLPFICTVMLYVTGRCFRSFIFLFHLIKPQKPWSHRRSTQIWTIKLGVEYHPTLRRDLPIPMASSLGVQMVQMVKKRAKNQRFSSIFIDDETSTGLDTPI